MELERIKTTPFHRLQRKELKARKLLVRFHEDSQHDEGLAVRFGMVLCECMGFLALSRWCEGARCRTPSTRVDYGDK